MKRSIGKPNVLLGVVPPLRKVLHGGPPPMGGDGDPDDFPDEEDDEE